MSRVRLEILPWAKRPFDSRSTGRTVLNEAIGQGDVVADLLIRLASKYRWFGKMVFDDSCSQISRHISVMINDTMLELPQGLSTRLRNGNTVTLVHALTCSNIE